MSIFKKSVAVATIAIAAFAAAQTVRIELMASLSGIGKAKATWKINDRGTQKQAELQVEGENLPRNAPLSVTIGTNAPFAVSTNAFGTYRLTRRYTSAARPTITTGDSVTVANGAGVIIQSGVMQPK